MVSGRSSLCGLPFRPTGRRRNPRIPPTPRVPPGPVPVRRVRAFPLPPDGESRRCSGTRNRPDLAEASAIDPPKVPLSAATGLARGFLPGASLTTVRGPPGFAAARVRRRDECPRVQGEPSCDGLNGGFLGMQQLQTNGRNYRIAHYVTMASRNRLKFQRNTRSALRCETLRWQCVKKP